MGRNSEVRGYRYRQASPVELLPVPIQQVVLLGDQDSQSRREETDIYMKRAGKSGSEIRFHQITGSGHFELTDPGTTAWLEVKQAIIRMQHGIR